MRALLPGIPLVALLNMAAAQELRFQHLTTYEGLSDNAITCITEDRAGFVWIGTEHGLNRFDGNAVLRIDVIKQHITAVSEDRSGVLWIGTKNEGIIRYDPASGKTATIRRADSGADPSTNEEINDLFELNDTTLLIAARQIPLTFLDKRTLRTTYWADSSSLSPARASHVPPMRSGWCHAIVALGAHRLWLGFLNLHHSMLVDRGSLATQHLWIGRDGAQTHTCAAQVGPDLVLGGWQDGLDLLRPTELAGLLLGNTRPNTVLPLPDNVTALTAWDEEHVLVGTRQQGLSLVSTRDGSRTEFRHVRTDGPSLNNDHVTCLLRDRRGVLWVGTSNGLAIDAPWIWTMSAKNLYGGDRNDQPDLFFHRIESLPDGGMRIFTSEGFFVVSANGSIKHRTLAFDGHPLQPTAMGQGRDGQSVVGTESGLVTVDPKDLRLLAPFQLDGPGLRYHLGDMFQVRGVLTDSTPTGPVFLVATLGYGVVSVDARTQQVIGVAMPDAAATSGTRSLVNCMVKGPHGDLWMGSAGGIFRWPSGQKARPVVLTTARVTSTEGILEPNEDVRALLPQGDVLWAVTHSGTLLRVEDGRAQRLVPREDLRSAMHGLAADRTGRLWITTDDGLLRYDPSDGSFLRVPVNDGSDHRKLTRAITALPDGRIALCADNALITFDPARSNHLATTPTAYITSLTAAGRSVSAANGEVDLSYRASVLDIGISALMPLAPGPVRFQYRLDGIEDTWRSTGSNEGMRYAGVPVGTHALLVRTIDPYGRQGGIQRLLTIHVAGPLWQQWWFYALALVFTVAGLYALYRYRLAQALKLHAVRNRIASDLHDEVGSSLSSITIGSQLASQLSRDESEQVRKLMARIGETSSASLRSMSDIVWAIDPKNDQGEALVKRMRRIAQELLEAKGIDVSFSISGGVEDLRLPMNTRKELVLLFKEAVHNASKYSHASLVQVSLHRRNGCLTMSVKDDGRGFDPALHPDGHGLGSMHRRAAALESELLLNSAPGLGTLVGLEVDLTSIRD